MTHALGQAQAVSSNSFCISGNKMGKENNYRL